MNEQIKAPKIELSNEEIANLSDAEFKTLVIRMLTEMVEYGHKIEERVKAMKRETKENAQGTNSDGKETGTQINSLKQKEERKKTQTMVGGLPEGVGLLGGGGQRGKIRVTVIA